MQSGKAGRLLVLLIFISFRTLPLLPIAGENRGESIAFDAQKEKKQKEVNTKVRYRFPGCQRVTKSHVEHAQLLSSFQYFSFMASKTSIFFLVLCGVFLVIFLVVLFFLLYFFLRRACIVKAIEISQAEAIRQGKRLNGDRFPGLAEPDITSISTHAVHNEHPAAATSSVPEKPTIVKEEIELTIL